MESWVVAADDRTGALEIAAEMAVVVGAPASVVVGAPLGAACVVDLGSRALPAGAAAAAAAQVDAVRAGWTAHKIDSTLRGNWAVELAARQRVLLRPVVVLPAWPAMGRTCRDGVVHVQGTPVAAVGEGLPRARRVTLRELGAGLEGTAMVWLDLETDADLVAAAEVVAPLHVLVAGPAGALGAVARARFGPGRVAGGDPLPAGPPLAGPVAPGLVPEGPVLVVCGSATEASALQLAALAAACPDIEIAAAPPASGPLDPSAAERLAARVRSRLHEFATVVVVGGDTAAAVLGNGPRLVGGYAAPGMPVSRAADGSGPVVVTKAGGFGPPDALVALLRRA